MGIFIKITRRSKLLESEKLIGYSACFETQRMTL